jgi:hypothetical protein
MRPGLWGFWIAAAIVVYAFTREVWALGIAVAGPLVDIATRTVTGEPGPEASWLTFKLGGIALAAAICLGFGIADANAGLVVVGAIGLLAALFFLWRRRIQAFTPGK